MDPCHIKKFSGSTEISCQSRGFKLDIFSSIIDPSLIFLLSTPLLSRLPLEVAAAAHAASGKDQGGQNPTSYQGTGKPEETTFTMDIANIETMQWFSVLMIPDE